MKKSLSRRGFLRQIGVGTVGWAAAAAFPGTARGANRFAADGYQRPNILFLFTDDQTYGAFHALGNEDIQTPNLDRLASRGVTFTHCFNQGSFSGAICIASRAMLNTGRYVWTCGGGNCGDGRYPLWGEVLGQAGYDTYVTGKWHNGSKAIERSFKTVGPHGGGMLPSRDTQAEKTKAAGRVKDPYDRPRPGNDWQPDDQTLAGHWQKRADGTVVHSSEMWAENAISFLRGRKDKGANRDPFFAYVAFHAPHDPRQSPTEFVRRYPPSSLKLPPNVLPEHPFDQGDHRIRDERLAPFPRTPEAVRVHLAEYYAIVNHADTQIGRILDVLEETGEADNTIIIMSSDHGLAVGQHGLMGKQNQYDHSVRMPLIITGPGVPAGRRIDALVYLQSMFATTCDMAGVTAPDTVQFPSLVPLITGKAKQVHDCVYGAYRHQQRMVRTPDWKLIRYPHNGEVQLFDLRSDPWETKDLAELPAHAARLAEMDAKLEDWMAKADDPLLKKGEKASWKGPAAVAAETPGFYRLKPEQARTGGGPKYQPKKENLGGWTHPSGTAAWELLDLPAGRYHLRFSYGCTQPGILYTIQIGKTTLTGKTETTGGLRTYKQFDVGVIELPAGNTRLTLKSGPFKGVFANIRGLELEHERAEY